jgi:hypothetical protein
VVVIGHLPLTSGAEPLGHVEEGGCSAVPVDSWGLNAPVFLKGEVSLQSILFPLGSYSHV